MGFEVHNYDNYAGEIVFPIWENSLVDGVWTYSIDEVETGLKGVAPENIGGIEDLHKLPFISKEDLRDQYPYGFLATDIKNCVRIHSTSGTTGRRVVAFYTQRDIDMWEECCARAIVAAGGSDGDICHVSYGYGLFTGGSGLHGGSHKVG